MAKIRAKNKIVGEVIDGKFIKHVKGSRHFLKVPPAIAFDEKSISDAIQAGAKQAVVVDEETGIVYHCPIIRIIGWGFYFDRGYGKQIALIMEKWDVVKPPITQWAEQPALFEGE